MPATEPTTDRPDGMSSDFRDDLRHTYDRQASGRDAAPIEAWKAEERAGFLSLLQREEKRTLLEINE